MNEAAREVQFRNCLSIAAGIPWFVGENSAPQNPLPWELASFPSLTLTRLDRLAAVEFHAVLDGLSHPDIARAEELTLRGLIELAAQLWWISRGDPLLEGQQRPVTDTPARRSLCYEYGAQRQLSQAIEQAPDAALIGGQREGAARRLEHIRELHEHGGCDPGCDGRSYKHAETAVLRLAEDLSLETLAFIWRLSSLAVHQALLERLLREVDGGLVVDTLSPIEERQMFLDRALVIYGVCATSILELVNPGALEELGGRIQEVKDCLAG